MPRVAGVVAELGGSTSHLASLARERGIPMVLGVLDATAPHSGRRAGRGRRRRRHRAVDGADSRPRIFVTQPVAAQRASSGCAGRERQGQSRRQPHHSRRGRCIAAVRKATSCFCLLHDRIDRAVVAANPKLPPSPRNRSRRPTSMSRRRPGASIPVTVVPPVDDRGDRRPHLRADARGGAAHDRGRPAGARRQIPRRAVAPSVGRVRLGQDHRPGRRRRADRQGGGATRARLRYARALLDAAPQARKPRSAMPA